MQNNPEVIKKAKQYVKRYKIWCTVLAICIVLGYCLIAAWSNAIALLFALIVFFIGSPILFNKCILSILNKKLDADTYLDTVYQGKFDKPTALYQLYGEYFCGHYQNVISICKMKLDDPKIARYYKYYYLSYLANVYFDIGDDENLRKIHERYEAALAKEKPSRQAKYRARLARMTFYDLYLKRNMEACMAWIDTPAPAMLTRHYRTFCKARLALLQGNADEANRYYEALAKEASTLNYGKLAASKLAAQGYQAVTDHSATFEISDEPTEVALYPANRRKLGKLFVIWLIVLFLYAGVGILNDLKDMNSEKKYEQEMDAYRESIRVLVEMDYDGVEVLDTFTLKNGEEIVDAMFICKTDTDIMVGCLYTHGDQTERYYKKMADVPIASLSADRSPLWYWSFPAKTSHNQIESYFYTVESDIPAEYCHLSAFEINGQKVYYVVTEIVPGIVIIIPGE